MINDLKLGWKDYLEMPIKMKEYFVERVKEINEKRAKLLK